MVSQKVVEAHMDIKVLVDKQLHYCAFSVEANRVCLLEYLKY